MILKQQPYVYAQLPHAGLGHMLLIWARALIFARLNEIPLFTSSWTKPRIGPILRREYSTRFYWNQLQPTIEVPRIQQIYARHFYTIIKEPTITRSKIHPHTLYLFNQTPHWAHLFAGFQPHRMLIANELYQMVTPQLRNIIETTDRPCIAVHVRHGDFKTLSSNIEFKVAGATRTPIDYFIERIEGIRSISKKILPVTVFSDGEDSDLAPLLSLPATTRAVKNADIVDLLLLARAQLLIASAGSSFSYWAGFLANSPLILHPDHIHEVLRPAQINKQFFEGGIGSDVREWPPLLVENIQDLQM